MNATIEAVYMGNILNLNIFLVRGGDLAYVATITSCNSNLWLESIWAMSREFKEELKRLNNVERYFIGALSVSFPLSW